MKILLKRIKAALNLRLAAVLGGIIVEIALIAALCINVSGRTNIQNEYTKALTYIGDEMYLNLREFVLLFDQVDVPGKDVQNDLLVQMEDRFEIAQELNDVLVHGFGTNYELLSAQAIDDIDDAFQAYDQAYRSGRSTQDARSAMSVCVANVRTILMERYNNERLMPKA